MNPPDSLVSALADRYRIGRELGEGGMATVYLATDLKHNRQVAIKVLKDDLAAVVGEERFLAEIETTAQLQHPHILPLFDSGAAEGFLWYAMPYVQGETLRDRLTREVQLPVEQAVELVQKIASALGYAHDKGIVHRDIKPENILLSSGEPLVADFGIALAVSQANDGRRTETGVSLGTPFYMSPEQAAGDRSLDPRSDIYALGCVLHELLTGEPPFSGANVQAVLARILTTRPAPVTRLRPTVPLHVESAVSKALEKLPADRFHTAKDFRTALGNPDFRHTVFDRPAGTDSGSVATPSAAIRSGVRPQLVAGIAAVALVVGGIGSWALLGSGDAAAGRVGGLSLRTALDVSELPGTEFPRNEIVISDDGSHMAWATAEGIWVRGPLDERFQLLPGTESSRWPSFSPDGDWIAYRGGWADLWRVSLSGGSPRRILRPDALRSIVDIHWGPDGMITLAAQDSGGWGLFRVSDTGGEPELVLRTGAPPVTAIVSTPFVLPDGSGTLGTARRGDDFSVVLHITGEDSLRVLVRDAVDPSYVEPGYLVFASLTGDLMAQRFDLERHTLLGDPKPMLSGLRLGSAWARYDVSASGTLVFGTGRASGPWNIGASLTEIGFDGSETRYDLRPRLILDPRWSPDARHVAWIGPDPEDDTSAQQVWIYDTRLGNRPTPLTVRGDVRILTWSPDGSRLAFSTRREGDERTTVWTVRPGAPPDSIWSYAGRAFLGDWPSDSLFVLLLDSPDPDRFLTLTPAGDTAQYYAPDASLDAPVVSPDGRWMAYSSSPAGQNDWAVYVRSFPVPGAEIRISEGQGDFPIWSPDGRTLYFATDQSFNGDIGRLEYSIAAADLELAPTLRVIRQRQVVTGVPRGLFDLHPDGDRFLMDRPIDASENDAGAGRPIGFHVIHNWFAELERTFDGSDGR